MYNPRSNLSFHKDETSISLPCVTCVNSTAENYGQHFSKTLEGVDHINFNYLGQVFQQKVSVEPGDCGILANVAARRKTCGIIATPYSNVTLEFTSNSV